MSKPATQNIIVCYLRSSSTLLQDHFLNRMAAIRAPATDDNSEPMVHVELYFPDPSDRDTGLSAGIHYGGRMFMFPKTFKRTDWTFHSVPATQRQVAKAKAFCRRQLGASFNYQGFFLPSPCNLTHSYRVRNADTKRMQWYCSELVSYALHHAGILDDAATKHASKHPTAMYNVMNDHCDTYMDSARSLKGNIIQL